MSRTEIPKNAAVPVALGESQPHKNSTSVPARAAHSMYDLVNGSWNHAVSLPDFLRSAGNNSQVVEGLLQQIELRMGFEFPPGVMQAVLQNLETLPDHIAVTPQRMADAIKAANAAYQAGKLKAPPTPAFLLPPRFDFSNGSPGTFARNPPKPKEIIPNSNLYVGDLPSQTDDKQIQRNRVLAEVLQRLSNNNIAGHEKFEVVFKGKSYSQQDDFLNALTRAGWKVSVSYQSRAANLINLKTQVDGEFVDVPVPLMLRTGITDREGREAVVGAVHSEMVISVKAKHEETPATVRFFQGVDRTGYFSAQETQIPKWCGLKVLKKHEGNKALRAVSLSNTLAALIAEVAKENNLFADGYGLTGVCNDSVALILQALDGEATQYPLMMHDALLIKKLKEKLTDDYVGDDENLKLIRAAIEKLESDLQPSPTARRRILQADPWQGKPPLRGIQEAYTILKTER